MKERVSYIDVAKGLLIVLVILHHLPQYALRILSIENDFLVSADDVSKYYAGFFMQAFFFISGYCSNFDIEFKPFLLKNIRTILAPMLFFHIMCYGIDGILHFNFNCLNSLFTKDFWLYFVEEYWFLSALFIMKMLYYTINSIMKNRYVMCVLILLLMIVSIAINNRTGIEDPSHYRNFWHYRNAFSMLLFLAVGHFLRNREVGHVYLQICGVCYFLICIYLSTRGIPIPQYTHRCLVSTHQIPLFMLIAFLGIGMVLGVAKTIGHNRYVEFLGRNSLTVYATQILCISCMERLYLKFFDTPCSMLEGFLFYVLVALLSLASCSCFAYIINKKYVAFIIGKW